MNMFIGQGPVVLSDLCCILNEVCCGSKWGVLCISVNCGEGLSEVCCGCQWVLSLSMVCYVLQVCAVDVSDVCMDLSSVCSGSPSVGCGLKWIVLWISVNFAVGHGEVCCGSQWGLGLSRVCSGLPICAMGLSDVCGGPTEVCCGLNSGALWIKVGCALYISELCCGSQWGVLWVSVTFVSEWGVLWVKILCCGSQWCVQLSNRYVLCVEMSCHVGHSGVCCGFQGILLWVSVRFRSEWCSVGRRFVLWSQWCVRCTHWGVLWATVGGQWVKMGCAVDLSVVCCGSRWGLGLSGVRFGSQFCAVDPINVCDGL